MTNDTFFDDVGNAIRQHVYRYLIADIRTGTVIAELPCNGCSYTFKLNDEGSLSAEIQINDETLLQNPKVCTVPGRNIIYVIRDEKVVWGGIIWGREYSVADRSLAIDARSFESYFNKLFNTSTQQWKNTEQLDMARWLMTSRAVHDILDMDISNAVSGRTRDRSMYGFEFKSIGEELSQLSSLIDGFDYGVRVYNDPQTDEIRRKLEFYYPAKGRIPSKSDLKFEYPGAITSMNVSYDAIEAANIVYALGSGSGSEMVVSVSRDEQQLADRWPPLEISRSFKSVKLSPTLKAHADNVLSLKKTPIEVFDVSVRADSDPAFGSYEVGDWALFDLDDPFIGEFSAWRRIVEIKVAVSATGIEAVDLTLDAGQEPHEEEEATEEE